MLEKEIISSMTRFLRVMTVLALLTLCATLAWYAPTQYALRFQRDDIALSLDTSRQRERKQQFEYDEAAAALPEAQALLAELAPQAEAARAQEKALREQRKALRADAAALAEHLTEAQAARDSAQARLASLTAEVEALRETREILLAQLEALQGP